MEKKELQDIAKQVADIVLKESDAQLRSFQERVSAVEKELLGFAEKIKQIEINCEASWGNTTARERYGTDRIHNTKQDVADFIAIKARQRAAREAAAKAAQGLVEGQDQ